MSFRPTADLCDQHMEQIQIAEPLFSDYGGKQQFCGPISTIRTFEDNGLVRQILKQPGEQRVLVVDGGESMRRALLGDRLAQLAIDNGWCGVLISGCVRDSTTLATMDIGIKALGTHPCKGQRNNAGEQDVAVYFAGVRFTPGHWLYADADGVVVCASAL